MKRAAGGRKLAAKQRVRVTAKVRHEGKGLNRSIDIDSGDLPYLVAWPHFYNGGLSTNRT